MRASGGAGASIGIVGGGQLAWMLARAAAQEGVALHVQTPNTDDPAARIAASVVQAPVDDAGATRELARRCSAISFENEWLDLEALEPLRREGILFLPDLDALRPILTKRDQRELLNRLQLPCPAWTPLAAVLPQSQRPPVPAGSPRLAPPAAAADEPDAPPGPHLPEGFGFPLMAKAVSGGYDGRGTLPLADQTRLEALLERVDPGEWILEAKVPFELELAMVACRDRMGSVVCYPLVQTRQHGQVCDWVLFPAPVDQTVVAFARNVTASLLTALDYVGVMGVEFFYGPQGLQVNELAPRTHNSGHLTIEAFTTSQFRQQVRIVAGGTVSPATPLVHGAAMVNLLGFGASDAEQEERLRALRSLPGAHLHWYGKQGGGPGRKLGHLTLLLSTTDAGKRAAEAKRRIEAVRRIWPLPPLAAEHRP